MPAKHGKKYQEAAKLIEPGKLYTPKEAFELLKQTAYVKFDPTIELHIRMGVDPRHADQMVRGVAGLPAGTGKTVRVAAFVQGDKMREAQEAGADFVGLDDLIKQISDGWFDFDVAVATPDVMAKVGRLGKILGPRGLMPNPKSNTIDSDIGRAIRAIKAGRVEFRIDKTSLLHMPIGKVSFSQDQMLANFSACVDAVVKAKPSGAKGQYIKSMTLTSTMAPGIPLDLAAAQSAS